MQGIAGNPSPSDCWLRTPKVESSKLSCQEAYPIDFPYLCQLCASCVGFKTAFRGDSRFIVDPSENIPICTTMPFADRTDEDLVGVVVVISIRAIGIEEQESGVFADERIELIEDGRCDPRFQEKNRMAEVASPDKPFPKISLLDFLRQPGAGIDPHPYRDADAVGAGFHHPCYRSGDALPGFPRGADQEVEHDGDPVFPA